MCVCGGGGGGVEQRQASVHSSASTHPLHPSTHTLMVLARPVAPLPSPTSTTCDKSTTPRGRVAWPRPSGDENLHGGGGGKCGCLVCGWVGAREGRGRRPARATPPRPPQPPPAHRSQTPPTLPPPHLKRKPCLSTNQRLRQVFTYSPWLHIHPALSVSRQNSTWSAVSSWGRGRGKVGVSACALLLA